MNEIGGYFQLEQLSGEEYYPDLLPLNLGRTALLYALRQLRAEHLWIPDFLCDSVTGALEQWEGHVSVYEISEDFLPVPESFGAAESFRKSNTWVYIVNYYGQLSNDQLAKLRDTYGNIIADNTHSFYQRPLSGVPTLFSCRKYFGVPDGAYLSLPQEPADFDSLPADCSADRFEHLLGRYEKTASMYYQKMLDTAHSFCEEPVRRMSGLTRNLLRGIDYRECALRREDNYRTLAGRLDEVQSRHFRMSEGPFVYPFYSPNARALSKKLAAHKIYVPTYWSNVIQNAPRQSAACDLAAHILPLPVDQRYGKAEMDYLADVLLSLRKEENDL